MLRRFVATALLAAALSPLVASAQVVYDNGAPNSNSGNEMTGWVQAEDFTLGSATSITGIRFWAFGFSASDYQGSIAWSIYGNSANQPGPLLFSGTSLTAPTNQGPIAYGGESQLQFDIATNFLLGAGTYWLGLHNGALSTNSYGSFFWQTTTSNGTFAGREDETPFGDAGWYDNGQEHAFQLTASPTTVPEPSTYALMGSGLAALLFVRRRRRA